MLFTLRGEKAMQKEPLFETERLSLHLLDEDDLDDMAEMFSCPITARFWPKTLSRQESLECLHSFMQEYTLRNFGRWGCKLKATGEFVGYCGLRLQTNIDGQDEVEVGYMLKPKFWNKGLATEAAKASMKRAKELGLSRLISLIRPDNVKSRRVAEKNGLAVEKEVIHKGFVHLVYAISI